MIVFGGVTSLEDIVSNDEGVMKSIDELFTSFMNPWNGNGSHNVRTEEAMLIVMSELKPKIVAVNSISA
jgi:predicted SPOUT superfamily RNA methylase MTH1